MVRVQHNEIVKRISQVLRHIPAGATATYLDELAAKIEPVVARAAEPEPRGTMFIS